MATVWAAGAIAALLGLAGLLLLFGSAILTRHRAVNAADLAALAAAGQADLGVATACGRAQTVAEEMTVRLVGCRLDGWDALVEVEAAAPGGLGSASAHARAGPVARAGTAPAPAPR
ncbi:Rv3654c family TadE-like protein [Amycolatopsis sp.]|uniref:Rv3654c family TadE-like protein n=1 Tax=Amycolatopsis sp. TaxID=37632 RepID=UPI002BA2C395|nr:Rv3654c family TadE-like protein [Amycolatopsis sp.]HVV12307.1 Rv3654c family TadE-like protein [Amycolatopsis sp.]